MPRTHGDAGARFHPPTESSSGRDLDWVNVGYIGDPLAGNPVVRHALPNLDIKALPVEGGLRLPLDILLLEARWSQARIEAALRQAEDTTGT